ncbi:hypothetical protein ACN42_g4958 [Penicillium freii]|uniref:Uncharacterized protein n=1 Tax=Penicillium freii TaxID=48697 RepID=A0A101MKB9_PENFR|nr:hypothetical protein ACN42_g4958 [Penicillium freii]
MKVHNSFALMHWHQVVLPKARREGPAWLYFAAKSLVSIPWATLENNLSMPNSDSFSSPLMIFSSPYF